jgi:hypothetical protein
VWFWPIMVRNHSSSLHIKLKLNWIEQQLYASRSLQSRIWNWKIFIFPNCHTKNLSLETFKSTERGSTLMVAKPLLFKKKVFGVEKLQIIFQNCQKLAIESKLLSCSPPTGSSNQFWKYKSRLFMNLLTNSYWFWRKIQEHVKVL